MDSTSGSDKFALKWENFHENLRILLGDLNEEHLFADVTLVSDDHQQIEAHKLILSASSSFFKTVLMNNTHQHPLIYLRGINMSNLRALVDFMYQGKVEIEQENLDQFLCMAKDLKVKGLTNEDDLKSPTTKPVLNYNDSRKKEALKPKVSKPISSPIENESSHDAVGDIVDMSVNVNVDDFDFDNQLKKEVMDVEPYQEPYEEPFDLDCHESYDLDCQENADSTDFIEKNLSGVPGLYHCNICGYESKKRKNVKSHIETHTEAPSYACPLCDKMVRTKSSLRMHLKRTHDVGAKSKCVIPIENQNVLPLENPTVNYVENPYVNPTEYPL